MNEHVQQTHVEDRPRHGMVALEGEGETERNRLLRRIDWRFLTGKPYPGSTYVLSGDMLAKALALVSREMLGLDGRVEDAADLAAAVNPDRADLEQAWQALEPGGVFYGEWYRPSPGGLAGLYHRLRKIGFVPVGSYWPWPWPERGKPSFWLPLEAPAALRYFLKSRPPALSLLGWLKNLGLQYAWRLSHRVGLLVPVCVIAYKPLETGAVTPLPDSSLAARAVRWGLARDGTSLHWLLLTGGLHSTNKVTGLVFQEDGHAPSFVVKLPRRELSVPSLEREAQVLKAIHSDRSSPLPGVPELVFSDTNPAGGMPAVGQTHLPGVPLYTVMQPGNLQDLAQKATGWLLHLLESAPPRPPTDWWDRLVEPVLTSFEQGYSTVGGQPVLQYARNELARLGSLPLAVEHRDFSPWNVFMAPSGELTVLDWEGAEPSGLPLSDLLYFLTYLAFFSEGALEAGTAQSVYRKVIDSTTSIGAIVSSCIQEYSNRASLPGEALLPLRLLTWMRHAALEHKLIENSSSGKPDPEMLRRGIYLSLLQIELEIKKNG